MTSRAQLTAPRSLRRVAAAIEGGRGRSAAAQGHRRGRPRARRELARNGGTRSGVIVDYHMHLRDRPGGEAQGRYGADRGRGVRRAGPRARALMRSASPTTSTTSARSESLWEIGWMQASAARTTWTSTSAQSRRRNGAACRSSSGSRSTTSRESSASSPRCSSHTPGTTCSARCTSWTGSRSTRSPGSCTSLAGRRGLAPLLRLAAQCGSQRALRRPFSPGPDQVLRPASRP